MDRLVSNEYQKIRYGWKCVTLYIWRSVCIFSILLSVHFLNILTSGIVICNVYLVSKRKGKKLLVVWKMNRMNISLFSCLETLEETRIENRGTFKLPYTVLYGIVGGGGEDFGCVTIKFTWSIPGCLIFSWSPPSWQIIGSQLLWSRLYTLAMTDRPSVPPWKLCDPSKIIQAPPPLAIINNDWFLLN